MRKSGVTGLAGSDRAVRYLATGIGASKDRRAAFSFDLSGGSLAAVAVDARRGQLCNLSLKVSIALSRR